MAVRVSLLVLAIYAVAGAYVLGRLHPRTPSHVTHVVPQLIVTSDCWGEDLEGKAWLGFDSLDEAAALAEALQAPLWKVDRR